MPNRKYMLSNLTCYSRKWQRLYSKEFKQKKQTVSTKCRTPCYAIAYTSFELISTTKLGQ